MNDFDKKLKEMSKDMTPPEHYQQRIDKVLENLPEKNPYQKENRCVHRRTNRFLKIAVCSVCMLLVCVLAFGSAQVAKANIFTQLKQTIMEFFHIGQQEASDEYGVESEEEVVISKPDLYLELREKIVDKHSMYVLVSITAPPDVSFDEQIGFDYYAFCNGSSYNADQLIGGAKDCCLLEVQEEKPNVATFVVSISSDEKIEQDTDVTLYFKDLMREPFGENPQMLVEGMWSLTFQANYTVSEDIVIKGTPDMKFEHDGGEVTLKKIELSPLGISVTADVTNLHYADQAYSNETSLPVKLRMVDGSQLVIYSHDPEEPGNVSMGSDSFRQPGGKEFLTSRYEFEQMVDIRKVIGIYVEDYYVSLTEG